MLGQAPSAMVLTARGPEQQAQGVDNTLAYLNVALALGLVGAPFSGFGTITGQGNGQGGREHGQKADQLPGYRRIDDPAARAPHRRRLGRRRADLPGPGKSPTNCSTRSARRRIRALFVMGSNLAVSAPDALRDRASGCGRSTPWSSSTSSCPKPRSSPTSSCRARSGPRKTAR